MKNKLKWDNIIALALIIVITASVTGTIISMVGMVKQNDQMERIERLKVEKTALEVDNLSLRKEVRSLHSDNFAMKMALSNERERNAQVDEVELVDNH